eukprot:scaffold90161_cov73-Cyclotella_meneghiniana.AAC.1
MCSAEHQSRVEVKDDIVLSSSIVLSPATIGQAQLQYLHYGHLMPLVPSRKGSAVGMSLMSGRGKQVTHVVAGTVSGTYFCYTSHGTTTYTNYFG